VGAQGTPDTTHVIVDGPIGARADSALTRLQASGFSGVALVAKDGRVVLKKGYGLANRATQTAMTGNSVVQIGSNTKDFTIVSILQLQERGRLMLDDSITKYLANVPTDKRGITVRELLFHRAGFDQHLGGDWEVVSRDEELSRALSSALLFAPGTDRKYSNIGYSLLAAIIEKVSGTSYDEYVRDNILIPLGLHETGLLLPRFDPARVAHGYRDGRDAGTFLERPHAADGPYWNLRGNGGMLSTVSDMYRFYQALMSDGPLLKPTTRDIFFHPGQPAILAGSDLTYFFFYSRYPGARIDAILVSNATDYPAERAREELDTAVGVVSPAGARVGGPGMNISVDTGRPARATGRTSIAGSGRDAAGLDAGIAIPDTPAGRAVRKYLRAYLDADTATMRRFLQEEVIQGANDHRTLQERVATFKTMHDDLGFLTPVEVLTSTEREIVIRMRAALGGQATFTFAVEENAPYRIVSLRVERQ
jgi:CubicO group peptidase (beta-lactamase class C family)